MIKKSTCYLPASGLFMALIGNLSAYSEAITPEFVDQLNGPYLSIENSLANDDLDAAQTEATTYLQILQGEDPADLEELTAAAQGIVDAEDLDQARREFGQLTQARNQLMKAAEVEETATPIEEIETEDTVQDEYERGGYLPDVPGLTNRDYPR